MESVDYLTHEVLRLAGNVRGKRVLELGYANEALSSSFVAQGATPILIEESKQRFAEIKRFQEQSELKFEIRHNELADLAFCPAESIDLAISAISFCGAKDIARVFRQLQRVLKDQGILVFGILHPLALHFSSDPSVGGNLGYGSKEMIDGSRLNGTFPFPLPEKVTVPTFSETFSLLKRSGFSVDQILELPLAENLAKHPEIMLIKAHK